MSITVFRKSGVWAVRMSRIEPWTTEDLAHYIEFYGRRGYFVTWQRWE